MEFPFKRGVQCGDLIALIHDSDCIGYGKVTCISDKAILVDVGPRTEKILKELNEKGIPYCAEFA